MNNPTPQPSPPNSSAPSSAPSLAPLPSAAKSPKFRGAIAAVVGAIILAGLLIAKGPGGDGSSQGDKPFFIVRQGPLLISVTESGAIKPSEQLVLKSEVEGQTAILYLRPEGERVKKGDLLVELDASDMEDRRIDQEIRVQNQEASYVHAREQLEVTKNQAQSEVEKAELADGFAKQDLERYVEGEHPRDLSVAESKITLAKEDLTRAQEKYNWSKILYDEKYLALSELQGDELSAKKAQLDLDLAQTDLALLIEFTHVRFLAQLESDVRQAEMALERTRRKASADVVQAEADLRAKEAEFTRQKGKLEKLVRQIAKAKIFAPMDGLVIYASSSRGGWRGNAEPLDEGQFVRERQELIQLPTTSAYVAEVDIHESSLDKVHPGQPVRVTVDAIPGKTFAGTVATIAPLPDAQSIFMNPDLKLFETRIDIEGQAEAFRNGMSCRAEIVIAQYDDAVYVPVQAILRVGGRPTVYVEEKGDWVPRTVELGLDNNRLAHIISGLEPGEKVLLTPPLASGEIDSADQALGSTEAASPVTKPSASDSPKSTDAAKPAPKASLPQSEGAAGNVPRANSAGAAAAPRAGRSMQDASPDQREAMMKRFQSMSPEQQEAIRKRFESMTPEQREAMRQGRGQRRSQQIPGGGSVAPGFGGASANP